MSNDFDKFTVEEKRSYMFKKHIKDHLFEYVLDLVMPVVLTIVILYLCNAEDYLIGILVALGYSTFKLVQGIYHYKKEYIDVDIK